VTFEKKERHEFSKRVNFSKKNQQKIRIKKRGDKR